MQTHSNEGKQKLPKANADKTASSQKVQTTGYQLVDNRPETANQRKLQEAANNSPQVKRLGTFQEIANNIPQAPTASQFKGSKTAAFRFSNKTTALQGPYTLPATSISAAPVQLKPANKQVLQLQDGMEKELNMEAMKKRYKKGRSWRHPRTETKQETIVGDAIQARNILRNMDGVVRPALRQLESDISEQLKLSNAEEANTRHLTRALAVREKQCGLEAAKSNYTRLLSADDFTQEAAKGALFNDWGALTAAMAHGEFTHRVQWYVLMYGMSSGFTVDISGEAPNGFNHTPKEFLIAINLGGITLEQAETGQSGLRPTDQSGGHTLWDVLFDRSSFSVGGLDPENKEIGITDPERFMMMLDTRDSSKAGPLKRIMGGLTGDAPELSRILTKRQQLRMEQAKASKFSNAELDPDVYEDRKLATGRYTREGRGLLVRNEPQSLVGSKAKDADVVPYAPEVSLN